jgi:hypothetical protein
MSQASQYIHRPRELSSLQEEQEVLEKNDLSGSACSFVAQWDNFDTVVTNSKLDCKHCTARKEAIIKLIPDAATRLAKEGKITWHFHVITDRCDDIHIQVMEGDSELDPTGFWESIELFFLEKSK